MHATVEQIILDCETFDSTLQSLAKVFKCSPAALRHFLASPEIGSHYEKHFYEMPEFDTYLYQVVGAKLGAAHLPDAVYWFHTTRVLPGTTFAEGILPLGHVLPKLKSILVEAVDDVDAKERLRAALDKNAIGDFHYQSKTGDELHWGPYAILVRDVAFSTEQLGQHDYLGMPEIIEDICNGIEGIGAAIFRTFERKLRPAIVKFRAETDNHDRCVAIALCYVRSVLLEGGPEGSAVYCFDGEGVAVAAADIVKVEFVG